MASRFWVGGNGTWDASTTTNWSASSGGAGGQSVPTSADSVTLDGNSGAAAVITVNSNINAASVTLGVTGGNFTGTLDLATNNNSPTFGVFSFSGSGTRTLNGGSGLWTINGGSSNNAFDFTTTTGLTSNMSSTPISFIPSATLTGPRTFRTGGKAFGAITVQDSGTSTGLNFLIQDAGFTLASLSITSPLV